MEKLKTLKIKENTHLIIKWVQTQEKVRKQKNTDIDAVIFKALSVYAYAQNYPLEEALTILQNYESK